MCVLVVEDEPLILMSAAIRLQDADQEAITAAHGPETVAMIARWPARFTILVTDYHMPHGMTGGQLVQHMPQSHPPIPMLITTARTDVVTVAFRSQHGVEVLAKPYDADSLVVMVIRAQAAGGRPCASPVGGRPQQQGQHGLRSRLLDHRAAARSKMTGVLVWRGLADARTGRPCSALPTMMRPPRWRVAYESSHCALTRMRLRVPIRKKRFAVSLSRDKDAVQAALELPWTTSPVEGQVNRIKTIKRSMYGRADFDLLRARVLNAA